MIVKSTLIFLSVRARIKSEKLRIDEYIKIQVPAIIDYPIAGRCSSGFPLFSTFDYVIIKNGRIGYKKALESSPKKIFKINEIEKILLTRRTVSCWTSDHKTDLWARNGTEIEISFLLNSGEKYVLIPTFLLRAKKDWDWFLHELCASTKLPLEELHEKSTKKLKECSPR